MPRLVLLKESHREIYLLSYNHIHRVKCAESLELQNCNHKIVLKMVARSHLPLTGGMLEENWLSLVQQLNDDDEGSRYSS